MIKNVTEMYILGGCGTYEVTPRMINGIVSSESRTAVKVDI